jgi:hypothetical protein
VATIPVGEEFPVRFRWTFLDHWRRAEPVHVAITTVCVALKECGALRRLTISNRGRYF